MVSIIGSYEAHPQPAPLPRRPRRRRPLRPRRRRGQRQPAGALGADPRARGGARTAARRARRPRGWSSPPPAARSSAARGGSSTRFARSSRSRRWDRGLAGRLRIGVIPTVAPYLLPPALPLLRARHLSLDLGVREAQTDRLVEEVRQGALDAAVVALPASGARSRGDAALRGPLPPRRQRRPPRGARGPSAGAAARGHGGRAAPPPRRRPLPRRPGARRLRRRPRPQPAWTSAPPASRRSAGSSPRASA